MINDQVVPPDQYSFGNDDSFFDDKICKKLSEEDEDIINETNRMI